MSNQISVQAWDLKPIKYAWPGGYPVFYLAVEGFRDDETQILNFNPHDRSEFVCCADCAAQKSDRILTASDVNWEDSALFCEVCNKRVESAYAEEETV